MGINRIKLIQNMFTVVLCMLKYMSAYAYMLGGKSHKKLRFVVTHRDSFTGEKV
jgi:hypothetical protein